MPPWKVTVQFQTQFRPSGCGEGKLCEYQNDKTLDLRALQSATGLTLNQSPTPQEIRLSGCGDDGYRRPIDYILLSIGGNDIGFASLVAQDALLADTLDFDILRHFLQYTLGAIEDRAGAEKRLSFLEHIYTRLNEAFRTLMPMREHDMSRILLTAYPLPDGWKGASLCGDETEGARRADQTMDAINVLGGFMIDGAPDPQKKSIVASVHAAACELDVWRMKWMDEAAGASGSMNDACSGISSGSEPASKLPWGYVTGLVDKVWPHGFCAVRNCSGGHGSLDCAAETAKMPGFESGRIFGHPPPAQTSIPDVGQYRPYHTRERWFRTFNDAYLTTNWQGYPHRPQQRRQRPEYAQHECHASDRGRLCRDRRFACSGDRRGPLQAWRSRRRRQRDRQFLSALSCAIGAVRRRLPRSPRPSPSTRRWTS
jgi:hypothetical protein